MIENPKILYNNNQESIGEVKKIIEKTKGMKIKIKLNKDFIKKMKENKPKKRRITRASANSKARWIQNWVCERISWLLELPWGYEDEKLIQPRIMGQKGVDVILRGEAYKIFPFDVECKSSETWSIPAAIRQARKNTKEGRDWLLFMKRKEFQNPVVILDAKRFFEIIHNVYSQNSIYNWLD